MQLAVEKVLDRARAAFTERDMNRELYEDCYEFTNPYRNTFNREQGVNNNNTLNRPTKLYDATAVNGMNNFVSTMQANFTPVFSRWAEFRAGPGVDDASKNNVNKGLEQLTRMVFAYLDASNFHTAIAEVYADLCIGTGSLWLFEGDQEQPLNFVATPMSQVGLVEGRFGTVDGRFRKHKVKARLIEHTWRKAKLSGDLAAMAKDKPDQEVELIEGCYYDYDDFVWRYEVIHEGTKSRIVEDVFLEEPCFTPRWMKVPGHAMGIGPAILALADIRTINKMKEYVLRTAALNLFGVYTIVKGKGMNPNTVQLQPGAFIPVERNGGPDGPTIAPLARAGDFQMQDFLMNDLKDSIRKTMLDVRLPAETAQPKTAFEIAQRMREFQTDIGSAYGRLMLELVMPMFKRIVGILSRKGLIELPEGFSIDNFLVQVAIVSPIAQSQAMQDVERFMNVYQLTASINPGLAATAYDIEKLPQWLVGNTGATAELLRDDVDKQQLQQTTAQMLAQMQAEAQGAG